MPIFNLALKFRQVARAHPTRTALLFSENEQYSYAALDGLSDQIARQLSARGAAPGTVVSVSGEKSFATYATLVAVLKTGAAYSIFDPDSPPARLRKIFDCCRPVLVVYSGEPLIGPGTEGDWPMMDKTALTDSPVPPAGGIALGGDGIHAGMTAYIMFTSGSTGVPKGAAMSHANVLNFIAWAEYQYAITPDDRLTNVNPLFFDNSVFDFYASIFTGATLVPFTREETRVPQDLVRKVDALRCTVWFSVPTLLIYLQTVKCLNPGSFSAVTRLIFGGEGYPKARLKPLFELFGGRMAFFNVYGPTECTCICSSYPVSGEDFGSMEGFLPLGHLIGNFGYLIIDGDGRVVENDSIGELCLTGPQVGQGYYNDPERTAAAFIRNPRALSLAETMYRTGDLVSREAGSGRIRILGRKDNQIKHLGYRIELEEIENVLTTLDYVAQAGVLYGDLKGKKQIVAVVELKAPRTAPEIEKDARGLLPYFMAPSAVFIAETLPKNPNGKLDRKRLAGQYFDGKEI